MRDYVGKRPQSDRMRLNAPTVVLLLACSTMGTANEARFAEFIEANPVLEDIVCAYTTTATSSEYPDETRVERFSPSNGWRLVAVNGQPPSEEALADYAGGRKQRRQQRQQPAALDFAEMARADTVTITNEDADTITFSFTPGGERNEDTMDKMNGVLVVAKDSLRPLRVLLELTQPASPAPTVKLSSFRQEMTFAVEPTTGAALMSSMRMAMRGKAFVFKKIESESDIAVSDYDCHPE